MTEAGRISHQLRRALRGPAWHGDSLAEMVAGVTAEQAATLAIPGAHTIQGLVCHAAAWAEIALARIETGAVPEVLDEVSFPPPGDWTADQSRLFAVTDRLAAHIDGMSDSELDFLFPENHQSAYLLLHGVVQHHLYHAGQIALLKKLV